MAVRTAAHLAHLTTRSYSTHKALDEFYTTLVDLVDRYAEAHLGEHGNVTFPSAVPPKGDPDEILKDYLEVIREELDEESDHKTKETILTEIEELVLSTLYKLKLK
jgi:uncharacterized protein YgfB (UPF0149 family)